MTPRSDGPTHHSNVLSVDLASRRYRDFGFAFLAHDRANPEFPHPGDLGLQDPPDAGDLAAALSAFARDHSVGALLLDGPQAWRHPQSPIEHMRLCERVLNTPGKTGTPGHVKPRTYLNFIEFSIEVFARLRQSLGWPLLTHDWASEGRAGWLVESFPSSAWSALGLKRLPSSARSAKKADPWRRDLSAATGWELPAGLSHDELQAAIVLPAGQAVVRGDADHLVLVGVDPIEEADQVYEGLIAVPRL